MDHTVSDVFGGIVLAIIFAVPVSFVGVPVVNRLLKRSSGSPKPYQITILDLACLSFLVAAVSAILPSFLVGIGQSGVVIVVVAVCTVIFIWWFVIASSLARLHGISRRYQVLYQIIVIPAAFVAPVVFVFNALVALGIYVGNQESSVEIQITILIACVSCHLACIPLTSLLLNHADSQSFGERGSYY